MFEIILVSGSYVLPSVIIGFLISCFILFGIKKLFGLSLISKKYFLNLIVTWVICIIIKIASLYNIFTGSIVVIPTCVSLLIFYIIYLSKKPKNIA